MKNKLFKKVLNSIKKRVLRATYSMKVLLNWNNFHPSFHSELDELTPLVSIIIPTFNRAGPLIDAIKSIRENSTKYEIIVVNSGSGFLCDQWLNYQRKHGDLIVINDNGRKYGKRVKSQSYFYNMGYRVANGKYVVHFADDCVALPHWLDDVIRILESDEKIGLALFLGQPHYYKRFQQTVYKGAYNGDIQYFPVAHWFCARKNDLSSVNYLDEAYDFYCNDLDLSVRIIVNLHKRIVCSMNSRILHLDKNFIYREKKKPLKLIDDYQRFDKLWASLVGFNSSDNSSIIVDEDVMLEKLSEYDLLAN